MTLFLCLKSEDVDCVWWILKLTPKGPCSQRLIPAPTLLPLFCQQKYLCSCMMKSSRKLIQPTSIIWWKDGGVGGRSYMTQFCSNPACIGTSMSGQGSPVWHCFWTANWITAQGEDPFYPLSQQALSAECQISFKTSCHPKLGELV